VVDDAKIAAGSDALVVVAQTQDVAALDARDTDDVLV
jgi:hypothetical protein